MNHLSNQSAKLAWALALYGIACLLSCGGPEEPGVPSVTLSEAERENIVTFPVQPDGEIDASRLGEIQFQDSIYNFGTVDAGAVVKRRFVFENTGQAPLIISHASSTCGCTVPSYPQQPIAPGDTSSVLVEFNTAGKSGAQDKPVTLTANTFPNRTIVRMSGTVDSFE